MTENPQHKLKCMACERYDADKNESIAITIEIASETEKNCNFSTTVKSFTVWTYADNNDNKKSLATTRLWLTKLSVPFHLVSSLSVGSSYCG